VERLIGTLRRECLDQMLILSEAHLRRILTLYASYYNESRTHLSLRKDTPRGRAIQRYGNIAATPVLSGLHHRYARICFSERTALSMPASVTAAAIMTAAAAGITSGAASFAVQPCRSAYNLCSK